LQQITDPEMIMGKGIEMNISLILQYIIPILKMHRWGIAQNEILLQEYSTW